MIHAIRLTVRSRRVSFFQINSVVVKMGIKGNIKGPTSNSRERFINAPDNNSESIWKRPPINNPKKRTPDTGTPQKSPYKRVNGLEHVYSAGTLIKSNIHAPSMEMMSRVRIVTRTILLFTSSHKNSVFHGSPRFQIILIFPPAVTISTINTTQVL